MANQKIQPLRRGCYLSLIYSIGSISLACGSLLQIQNTTDRISLQRGLLLTSLGFLYFVSLTDFFNKYLLETPQGISFRRKYRLMVSDVMEITNKIVSAIQAAFSFLAGFIVCKSTCSKSFVYASHFFMEAYAWFGTAYFMYDIWSMYVVHTQKIADKLKLMKMSNLKGQYLNGNGVSTTNGLYDKHIASFNKKNRTIFGDSSDSSPDVQPLSSFHLKHHEEEIFDYDNVSIKLPKNGKLDFLKYILTHPVMMIHHVFIGTFGLLVVTYLRGGGHCIYSFMFMMEFSTPFVSARGILSTLGLKNSRIYIINGLLMLGTFFICRILMWPYVFYAYSVVINKTLIQAIMGLPRSCIISILILFLPQVYWFYLMSKGALQVFFKNPGSSGKMKNTSKNNNLSPTNCSATPTLNCTTNGQDQNFIKNRTAYSN